MFWKLIIAFVVIVSLSGLLYLGGVNGARLSDTLKYLERTALSTPSSHHPAPARHEVALPIKETPTPGDELVSIDKEEKTAIGLQITPVEPQTRPMKLELTGRTAYDTNTLTRIRPRFDTLIEHVYTSLGAKVKAGDPLVDMYSTELAKAKSDMQTKYVQWQHDYKLYQLREKLFKTGAISEQVWVDTQNEEKKSHLDYILARDLLNVYKVPHADIEKLIAPLNVSANNPQQFGQIEEKAKMTLLSPADGIVIEREVVNQNLYDTSSVLMVLAPLDHLWVLLNVYELDQDKIRPGQTMEIRFPFLEQEKIKGKVEYVASEVSKDTRAIKIRATIPNPGARLKSDMVLKAMLDIPPIPGQTVIPRLAMVSTNGLEYAFVRKPKGPDAKPSDPDQFERRRIVVAQENVDEVVVSRGLKAGEEVVSNGSLIIAQLFEDQHMVATGVPMQ